MNFLRIEVISFLHFFFPSSMTLISCSRLPSNAEWLGQGSKGTSHDYVEQATGKLFDKVCNEHREALRGFVSDSEFGPAHELPSDTQVQEIAGIKNEIVVKVADIKDEIVEAEGDKATADSVMQAELKALQERLKNAEAGIAQYSSSASSEHTALNNALHELLLPDEPDSQSAAAALIRFARAKHEESNKFEAMYEGMKRTCSDDEKRAHFSARKNLGTKYRVKISDLKRKHAEQISQLKCMVDEKDECRQNTQKELSKLIKLQTELKAHAPNKKQDAQREAREWLQKARKHYRMPADESMRSQITLQERLSVWRESLSSMLEDLDKRWDAVSATHTDFMKQLQRQHAMPPALQNQPTRATALLQGERAKAESHARDDARPPREPGQPILQTPSVYRPGRGAMPEPPSGLAQKGEVPGGLGAILGPRLAEPSV